MVHPNSLSLPFVARGLQVDGCRILSSLIGGTRQTFSAACRPPQGRGYSLTRVTGWQTTQVFFFLILFAIFRKFYYFFFAVPTRARHHDGSIATGLSARSLARNRKGSLYIGWVGGERAPRSSATIYDLVVVATTCYCAFFFFSHTRCVPWSGFYRRLEFFFSFLFIRHITGAFAIESVLWPGLLTQM